MDAELLKSAHEKGTLCFPGLWFFKSPIWATDKVVCLKRPLGLNYMSANSKGSGESALMRWLV